MPMLHTRRRGFLQATGVTIALPLLESLPVMAAPSPAPAPRMVCIGNEFGMYPQAFWPQRDGADYDLPKLLAPLEPHRRDLTVFSHLDHGLKGGHFAVHTFLTGVKSVEAKGMPDGGISLDQRAAEHVGARTRFPSLTIGSESGLHGGCQMSWTRTGTRVPPITGPRELFRQLFIDDDTSAKLAAVDRIVLQGSILDAVSSEAKDLQRKISQTDKRKLDEYFSSVRDVERRLELRKHWNQIPKPKTDHLEPQNDGLARDLPKLYDLIALALQTDSTRVATLEIGGSFVASDIGIRKGYHGLSHHGKVKENIQQLVEIEQYQVEQFSRFLQKLRELQDPHPISTCRCCSNLAWKRIAFPKAPARCGAWRRWHDGAALVDRLDICGWLGSRRLRPTTPIQCRSSNASGGKIIPIHLEAVPCHTLRALPRQG